MAEPPTSYPNSDDGTMETSQVSPPRAPRWVKVSGAIIGALILLFVALELTGLSRDHGPGRHAPGGHTPPVEHSP